LSQATPDRLASVLADRYRIESELGRGGMATVYLARDLKHRRDVAIKVLKPDIAAAIAHDRFLLEIEIAAQWLAFSAFWEIGIYPKFIPILGYIG
jgi:serine/threonine-protein kinase